MKTIPSIIHQTWKNENLSATFEILAKTWKTFLPNWEYILWTDEMNRNLVRKYFPEFLDKYDSYPQNIQRADAIRYLILKKYGGLYVDLDFECLENLEFLFDGVEFVAGKEPQWHAYRYNLNYIICNAFMASAPESDFINFVCKKLIEYPQIEIEHPDNILDSTGPFLLTRAYEEYTSKDNIRILTSDMIYPIGLYEAENIRKNEISEDMEKRINNAYAIHYFLGYW